MTSHGHSGTSIAARLGDIPQPSRKPSRIRLLTTASVQLFKLGGHSRTLAQPVHFRLGSATLQYVVRMADAAATHRVTIVPANEATWEDLQAVFGTRGDPSRCQCQRFKIRGRDWDRESASVPVEERAQRLREQTRCGQPETPTTSGLVAYFDGGPVGWCAVEPRTAYVRLLRKRIVWSGRAEDKTDDSVWAVTCFVTRTGFRPRRQPCSRARRRRLRAGTRRPCPRGFPMITQPGQEITWGELHVGGRSIFAAAGFDEVSRPSLRRVVMRIDF